MTLNQYLHESDTYIISLIMCMDNAHSVEKMYNFENLGNNNPAWSTGPNISAASNGIQIDRTQPYCLMISKTTSNLLNYQIDPKSKMNKNGGVFFCNDNDLLKATIIIPTTTICMEYALLEAFDFDNFELYMKKFQIPYNKHYQRYNRRPVESRLDSLQKLTGKIIPRFIYNAYKSLSNYRNKLTHEPLFLCNDPDYSLNFYITCQGLANYLNKLLIESLCGKEFKWREPLWENRLMEYQSEMSF